MRLNSLFAVTAAAGLLGFLTFTATTSQGQEGQPERPARQPESRPGGPGRGEAPNVEASMKGMNRALGQLKAQIVDPSKKDACLKLIGDAQRGCIAAKSGQPIKIKDLKDDAARAKASESFRRRLMAVARKLLDIEQSILDGKGDAAKAQVAEVLKMRDEGHEEFGVNENEK